VSGCPVVGFIGQLAGHKGLDTVLRAMPAVWRTAPAVNLLIAGGETLFAPHVQRVVASWPEAYRRRTRVCQNFPPDQKAWLFGAIDLLAYPSGYESFGIAYLEAWAAGKPVIGSRSGAIPTVIDEGVDGLLVRFQDHEALAGAILALLGDPARARAMGEAGRRHVLARYTWPRIAKEFRHVYGTVLGAGDLRRQEGASSPSPRSRA
jgi:glycosyltransferase involved in cell wall biosynthesis